MLADALAPIVWRVLGDPGAEVVDLSRLSGGASRETWSLDAVGRDGRARPLVLQRERAGGVRTGGGMAAEAALIRAAGAEGVPVPEVVAAGDDDGLGAPWLLAARLDGETIPRRILREGELADARPQLTAQIARAAAGIHRIPPSQVHGLEDQDQVGQFRDLLDLLGQPHPVFELGFRWLEANRPAPVPPAVVHGDLRLGNLIVGPEGLRAVLDWELAHLGDPLEDLGWLCVRSWRFGGPGRVGGVGDREELCAVYGDASGRDVEPADLDWWEALGTLKWGVMCIVQASSHLTGMTRSVELAAIGRRVAETEHDLLDLIAPDVPAAPPTPASPAADGPHDAPTAAQLVEAVREYLESDVVEATTGRVRFHSRVAANVLAMVERELRLGPAQAEAHRARLAALGVDDDSALAAAIRSGEIDDRQAEVTAALRAAVADKLAVSNPAWAD
jgi:aminoglycoside phosphotransferase (APT) family kinase protein